MTSDQTKLLDGRVECAVENECLDELWCLQQRILLAGCFGQVLIEIAQKPRVPIQVGEIVHECTRIGVDLLEEPQQLTSRIAAEPVG